METTFGSYYPSDSIGDRSLPDNTTYLAAKNIFRQGSPEAEELGIRFRSALEAGETVYLLGFLGTAHNSGLSLIEASAERGIVILANHEEERFSEIKHFSGYPSLSVKEMHETFARHNIDPSQIFGVFYAYDVVSEEQSGMRMQLVNTKLIRNKYYRFVTDSASPHVEFGQEEILQQRKSIFFHSPALAVVFRQLVKDLELRHETPCVQMLHHENHAYFSYGTSPFAKGDARERTTLISCIDGGGDLSSVSLFRARGGEIELIDRNFRANSLGVFYMLCASLLGGWTALSAEGRYMGAAAWGNGDRLTNPYYKQLRQFFYFGENGQVFANSEMAAGDFAGLQRVIGPFVALEDIWKPDAVINVDDIKHSPVTRDRVDKAAAVQMVFEDALFHIIGEHILKEKADQIVMCGGTALNCVSNMRLLDHFDTSYYRNYLGADTRLNMWVPPVPSDQGVVIGAPYQFAMRNGAIPRGSLGTPFLCGTPPGTKDIEAALDLAEHVEFEFIGDISRSDDLERVAEWMAYAVSQNAVVGIFQGSAETGPRALGHRSILSNPCNLDALEILNGRVKLREKIRPLAPMVTIEEAAKWFHLSAGAAADDYDAYGYMVLTVRAKEQAFKEVPAIIHHDGTSRIQIVRKENNELIYAYLKALGKHTGAEVSINTSLNVGTPIVQTPTQALAIFGRSMGLDCIFMVAEDGPAYMVLAKPGVQKYDSRIPELRAKYLASRPVVYATGTAAKREILRAFQAKEITRDDAKKRLEGVNE